MRTTSKITALAAAALATIALAACEPASNTTATTSSATIERAAATPSADWTAEPDDTAAEASTIMEDIYITVLDQQGAVYSTEAQAIDAAKLLCLRMDNGESLNSIMWDHVVTERPINSGVSTESTGAIAGAGVPAFCPRHQDQVDAFVETWAE